MSTESNAVSSRLGADASGVVMLAGVTPRMAPGEITISFYPPFNTDLPPVVVATPFSGSGAAGQPETITFVDLNGFRVSSQNAAPDSFVSWVAVAGATEYYYYADDGSKQVRVAKGRPAAGSTSA